MMLNSAAARVFGISELRELILLAVPNHKNAEDAQNHPHQPVIQLFALQRVNRDFRDTIMGSAALRARMTTPPFSATAHPAQLRNLQCYSWRSGKHIYRFIHGLATRGDGARGLKRVTKDATWRQLKVRNSEDVTGLKLAYFWNSWNSSSSPHWLQDGTFVRETPSDCPQCRMNDGRWWLWYQPVMETTSETTWGHVFDFMIDRQLEHPGDFISDPYWRSIKGV